MNPTIRLTTYRPTSDDWCPNHTGNTVRLSYIELTDGKFRVCVWGDDDCGMEKDFSAQQEAKKLYNCLSTCPDITKKLCKKLGMSNS